MATKVKQLNVLVTEDIFEAVRLASFEKRESQSEIVRQAVIQYLNLSN